METDSTFNIFSPEVQVVILTWVTFFIVLAILYKFTWKPILTALNAREEYIRRSLEEADAARSEMAKVTEKCNQLVAQADQKAKEIVAQARKGAYEAAKTIEQKAREETQILLENAQREINAQTEKAQAILRTESVEIAVALASKIIEENLDTEKNRKLVNELIKKL